MEVKKNPKKDLNKSSTVFFAAGMAMVMALAYVALEWKTFYSDYEYDPVAMVNEIDLAEDPIVINIPPPKPKPIITPPIIEIIPDEVEVPETIIDAIEPDQDTKIVDVEDIPDIEVYEEVSVPFSVIEDVPVFPGCENDKDKRACFNKMMQKHIGKTFRYPELEQEMGIQGKVNIMFEIQKDGSIGNVQMRGPNKNLEKEAARIISKLPKMTPGKQRGTAVRVPFAIPITFKLN